MEFEWSAYVGHGVEPDAVEESFEDPFSLRFLPDSGEIASLSRFFSLGKTIHGEGVFAVYSSDGKRFKVITARPMTEQEDFFYTRRMKEVL